MTQPNLGGQLPTTTVEGLARSVRALTRRLEQVESAAGRLAGAVIRRGLMTITDLGGLVVEGPLTDPATGNPTGATFPQFRWGALPDDPLYNHPDGSPQMAWLAHHDDGTIAMSIAELRASDGQYAQVLQIWDRSGDVIVAPDTNSGHGLARPHLAYPMPQPTDTSKWLSHSPAANNSDWTSIARCEPEPENPRMAWNVRTIVDAGVTAQYRWCWQLDAGVQAPVLLAADGSDATHTLTGDDPDHGYRFGFWRELSVPFPAGVEPQRRTTLDLQVRITAGNSDGTKVAKASVVALGGDQS